jgi:lipopolysaccharide/colanic/teichoic acid biosynthesis glycosyltransferase
LRTFPVFLDSCPPYLRRDGKPASLLLAPLGTSTLIDFIDSQVASGGRGPTVLSTFDPPDGYEEAIREACPGVEAVLPVQEFAQRLAAYEPSDCLLVIDPRLFPEEGLAPDLLLRRPVYDHRWVRHLVPLAASEGGTRECVELDADGQVRRIQRYYDDVTWPFAAGVCCSVLPGACAAMAADLGFSSLSELRRNLAGRGIPSRDLPVAGAVFDLSEEPGLLGLTERFIRKRSTPAVNGARNGRLTGRGCRIHPSSRIVGPVVLQDGVTVEEDATVVGPSLIGAGSRIEANAVVAQCVLGAGTVVARDTAVRHRALFGGLADHPAPSPMEMPAYRGPAWSTVGPSTAPENADVRNSYLKVRSVMEAVLALLALLLLSPLLLFIAALITLESRGGVFYADERESKGGRPFRCLKFRTMFQGADTQQRQLYASNQLDGPQFKLDHDPRVTRVGRWLRSISFDELPQLINVVRGEMSIVGPRPSPFRENQTCVPWRVGRLSVLPGITGLWQVCRHDRKAGDFHQWIYYDLLYVRHFSPVLDLKIILATVLTLGGRRPVRLSWMLDAADGTGRP